MPPQQPPPAFSMKAANGLYLDNQNHFLSGPLPDAPVYQVAGGLLSLTSETRDGVLSGTLAVLPLTEVPGWAKKLSDIGLDDESIALFGKAADLASTIVNVVGWAQAALKIAQLLGILKAGRSVEQLAQDILTKLGIVQDMVADAHGANVKLVLETSSSRIGGLRDQAATALQTIDDHDVAGRRAIRAEMLQMAEDIDLDVRALLAESRWELFNQSKQYRGTWSWHTETEEVLVENPPYWGGMTLAPHQRLGDDGASWVDVAYPAAYKLRFDYRAALPVAMSAVMSYLGTMTMAEPEFRSTGQARLALTHMADELGRVVRSMRGVLVRTHHQAHHLQYAGHEDQVVETDPDGLFGPFPVVRRFRLPHGYWHVGALDLCAHTDDHFTALGQARPYPSVFQPATPGYARLGLYDFDWLPPAPQLVSVESPLNFPNPPDPPNRPHWELANAQECADAANRQSEADLMVLMQSSGYFQLVQLEATLRHLATDPGVSETVTGDVVRRRNRTSSTPVTVVGRDGLLCDPADVTAAGTLDEFACRAIVSVDLQPPDRVHQLPTRVLLVALTDPADSGYATVLSEVELVAGTGPVTLPTAETFDLYVEQRRVEDRIHQPTDEQLWGLSGRRNVALSHHRDADGHISRSWLRIGEQVSTAVDVQGEQRNRRQEPLTFTCTYTPTTTDTRRSAWVELSSAAGSRNPDNVYVAVEEKLASGVTLRTHFDVRMHTRLTFLPSAFFTAERECLRRTTKLIDHIESHFSESVPRLPPHVPVTLDAVVQHLAALRTRSPDVVAQALQTLGPNL